MGKPSVTTNASKIARGLPSSNIVKTFCTELLSSILLIVIMGNMMIYAIEERASAPENSKKLRNAQIQGYW